MILQLDDLVEKAAPGWPRCDKSAVSFDLIPVMLSQASVKIDLIDSHPTCPLPEVTADPKAQNHWEGQDLLEEVLGVSYAGLTWRSNGNKYLGREDYKTKHEAEV